jgi:Spy/CpxP family protein refolding chaperone
LRPLGPILLTVVLSALAAGLAGWAGGSWAMHRAMHAPMPLHGMLHEHLNLSPDQKQRIDALEAAYGERRRDLEGQMREANAELAEALSADHAYTPRVQQAVDHFHHAMGELQKETILHVLAMRGVLTPAQTVTFDKTVAKALLQSPA